MDSEKETELIGLVIGFLIQSKKDYPNGFSLGQFERMFPEKSDEPPDWYKRYGKKNALEALEAIPKHVIVSSGMGGKMVRLNPKSDKIDRDLLDLVVNQKDSNKRRKGPSRPSSKALASFSLNRQYSRQPYVNRNVGNYRSRLNHDQQYPGEIVKVTTPTARPPSIYGNSGGGRPSFGDPRNRASMVPPQIRSWQAPAPPKTPQVMTQTPRPSTPKPPHQHQPATQASPHSTVPRFNAEPPKQKPFEREEDPVYAQKKSHLRQRLTYLLVKKYPEIKLMHLSGLYKVEFEESIEPAKLGHTSLTTLLLDPAISSTIQINYKTPVTISLKNKSVIDGKENSNGLSDTPSLSKEKLNAVDPFNVRTMLQQLEPLDQTEEPPLKHEDIDDVVKYKTFRIIFKSQNSTLKLEDWETTFVHETRFKIRIRDYGFRTVLEFFRKLSEDLPIKISRDKNQDWIAVADDVALLSTWIQEKLEAGKFQAIIAIDSIYELIALPKSDRYVFTDVNELSKATTYFPVHILSVERSTSMWIQLRTSKMIEDHLCIEASMTCYQDYRENNLFKVHKFFVKPGFPCAVYDSFQQRWCRALVVEAEDNIDKDCKIKALLVDYGVVRRYLVSQLSYLLRSHVLHPVGPVHCRLIDVNETTSSLDNTAKRLLHEYMSPPATLACKFLKPLPANDTKEFLPKSCIQVELVDTRGGKDTNLIDLINLSRDNDQVGERVQEIGATN